ncbi:alfa-L-arabinofuranosidase precursor [Infundibulicybe gibba]|nr:alfa-L-arabinofuranosidase precursor [Infundibulicybe gibba]
MQLLSSILSALALAGTACRAVTVSITATPSHSIPPTLCDGDGGLYAELLQNRAFQQVTPGTFLGCTTAALNAWQAVNSGQISVIKETVPVSAALPNALHLTVPTGRTGGVGFANTGYFGIKVTAGSTYTASFFYRFPTASSFRGNVVVGLQTTGGQVLASATAAVSGVQTTWTQVSVTLNPTTTPSSTSNLFTVTLDGAAASGQTINFAMLSLFPPTFKNRANGMRVDIAEALAEMGPSFFRLPGGNNLEGQTVATRWQWNNTVGSLVNRPGRVGDWGYVNTDGLGLLDYLNWCEDVGMEPIMAVWSGKCYCDDPFICESIAEAQLGPYIQQAIDQINFVIGDPSTSAAAALRASLGRSAPFALTYVEIGNEDFAASNTYGYRWHDFVTALTAQFPNLPWFAQNSFFYDGFQGEYAAISTNANDIFGSPSDGRLTFPTMQSSTGEAAFMTGLERNSDIVAGAVYRSTSFYVQKLFSLNRGDEYLPSTLPSRTGTLFWSVVRKTSTNQIIIKVRETRSSGEYWLTQLFRSQIHGTAQVISGAATTSNTPTAPNAAVPVTSTITTGKTFTYNAPGLSVSVLTFTAQ